MSRWQSKLSTLFDNEKLLAYLILLPVVFLIFLMAYLPIMQSLRFSFMNYNIAMPDKIRFVGLANYVKVFTDPLFYDALKRSTYFTIIAVVAVLIIAMGFALILNERFRGRSILRVILILPWAIPPVINGFMWRWILNGDFGLLNGILYQLGIISSYKHWLVDPFMALNFAVLTFVWGFVPFVTMLLLGSLQSIPPDLYEAAKVDGGGVWERFWHITLPLIRPMMVIGLIITTIAAFAVFAEIYSLTGLDPATKTLMMYNYELTFERGRIGTGSALAYVISIFMFLMAYLYIKSIYREVEY